MSLNDLLAAVSAVGAAVAAVAGVIAVRRAKTAIEDAREAQKQNSDAHREDMRQQTTLLEATHNAHEEEIVQQRGLLDAQREASRAQLALQQLAEVSVIADLLREIAHAAEKEIRPEVPDYPGLGASSPITAIAKRLELALSVYGALGGKTIDRLAEFASRTQASNRSVGAVRTDAMDFLNSLQGATVEPTEQLRDA